MNLHITKSKNAESFYIAKSYVKANGSTSSTIVRKLGTLNQLIVEHGPTRDDVLAWAKNEVRLETERYKKEKEAMTVLIPFHANRQLAYDKQTFYRGGYLFLQSVYYGFQLDKICRKLKAKYKFRYDINAILSDLIYARVLEPASKRSSFKRHLNLWKSPPMDFMMCTAPWTFLETNVILFSPKYTKTAISSAKEMIRYFTTIAPTIILRLNRRMEIKNMESPKNIGLIQSFRWDYLWTAMGSPLHFLSFRGTQMSRDP